MAAVTPTTVVKYSMGDLSLITAAFSGPSSGDTWASGINGVVDCWYQVQATPGTQASAGADVSFSGSTFTLSPGENSKAGKLFVLARNG